MTYLFDGTAYVVKLAKDERLSEALTLFVRSTNVRSAWVNGLGGARQVTLGFYELQEQQYHWQTFDELLECVSLTGNLALDDQGELLPHLHGTFSDRHYKTVGGHVKDLLAGATLELYIKPFDKHLQRKLDPVVGLRTLI